jgi:hypothetical protein
VSGTDPDRTVRMNEKEKMPLIPLNASYAASFYQELC